MIHDNLLALTAKWDLELHALLSVSQVFKTNLINHLDLPKAQDPLELERQAAGFTLPYPIITIEDPASSVTLFELIPARGLLGHRRQFIVATPVHGDERAFQQDFETRLEMREVAAHYPDDTVNVSYGWLEVATITGGRFGLAAGINGSKIMCQDGMFDVVANIATRLDLMDDLIASEACNAMRGIEQILFFNSHVKFTGWASLQRESGRTAKRYKLDRDGSIEELAT